MRHGAFVYESGNADIAPGALADSAKNAADHAGLAINYGKRTAAGVRHCASKFCPTWP